ncbi:MAG: serine hydroxymethyltransferase, partial [Desulfobacula sp.]|nr:serine hydroxymethyltransferase [Desulfobacula sp.]
VDFTGRDLSGKEAEERLGQAGIVVNKNSVPNEQRGPFVTSGIRIGLPLVTSRQMKEDSGKMIAGFICDVLDDASNIESTKKKVKALCSKYPIYT